MKFDDALYKYKAKVLRVVDGDTVQVELDHGCKIFSRQMLRLSDIDAPESRGASKAQGDKATDHLTKLLFSLAVNYEDDRLNSEMPMIYVETLKDSTGKYGRYLGVLWGVDRDGSLVNINDKMISDGHAVVWP